MNMTSSSIRQVVVYYSLIYVYCIYVYICIRRYRSDEYEWPPTGQWAASAKRRESRDRKGRLSPGLWARVRKSSGGPTFLALGSTGGWGGGRGGRGREGGGVVWKLS